MHNITWNAQLAKSMAYLSAASYCDPIRLHAWNCSPCSFHTRLSDLVIVQSINFQGLIGVENPVDDDDDDDDVILVAFRGSYDVMNWVDNLTFFRENAFPNFPGVLVHRGFFWTYASVRNATIQAVTQLRVKYPKAKVRITGHSLGAAVAVLCAFDLATTHKIPIDAVWTFGKPRVGNDAWKETFQVWIPRHYRITHYHDLVPHVPAAWMGFLHSHQEVSFSYFCRNILFLKKDSIVVLSRRVLCDSNGMCGS